MNGSVDIRACTTADLALLQRRWATQSGVHEAHHARQLDGGATYLVAWEDAEPLGAGVVNWGGCIGPRAREAFPAAVEIHHLQVRDEYRGRGVGSALIAAAERMALHSGRRQTAVGVADDNPRAERLYLRLGYRRTGVIDFSEYDWTASDGTVHHAVECDQLLLKDH